MNRTVEMLTAYRRTITNLLEGCSTDTQNAIPPGFNNNLIWNYGHVVVSQQTLCYLNAGLRPLIDDVYISRYRKGTKPEKPVDKSEFETLKKFSDAALLQLDRDLENDRFTGVKPFQVSSYGIEARNIGDILKILLHHEGLHLGYCMALKRALSQYQGSSL